MNSTANRNVSECHCIWMSHIHYSFSKEVDSLLTIAFCFLISSSISLAFCLMTFGLARRVKSCLCSACSACLSASFKKGEVVFVFCLQCLLVCLLQEG